MRLRKAVERFWNKDVSQLAPLISVVTMVGTLFFLVFLQMEERRMGYSVLKLGRIYREKLEDKHYQEIQLARSLRLEKVEALAARKLTLRRAAEDQVIHLNDEDRPIPEVGLIQNQAKKKRALTRAKSEGAYR